MAHLSPRKLFLQIFLVIILALQVPAIWACQKNLEGPKDSASYTSLFPSFEELLEYIAQSSSSPRKAAPKSQFKILCGGANYFSPLCPLFDTIPPQVDLFSADMGLNNYQNWPDLFDLYVKTIKPLQKYFQQQAIDQRAAISEKTNFNLRRYALKAHDKFLLQLRQKLDDLGLTTQEIYLTANARDRYLVFSPQDTHEISDPPQDEAQPITNVYLTRTMAIGTSRSPLGIRISLDDENPLSSQTWANLGPNPVWQGLAKILAAVSDFNERTSQQISVVCTDLDLIAMEHQQKFATTQKVTATNFGEQGIVFLPIDFTINPEKALQQIQAQLNSLAEAMRI